MIVVTLTRQAGQSCCPWPCAACSPSALAACSTSCSWPALPSLDCSAHSTRAQTAGSRAAGSIVITHPALRCLLYSQPSSQPSVRRCQATAQLAVECADLGRNETCSFLLLHAASPQAKLDHIAEGISEICWCISGMPASWRLLVRSQSLLPGKLPGEQKLQGLRLKLLQCCQAELPYLTPLQNMPQVSAPSCSVGTEPEQPRPLASVRR